MLNLHPLMLCDFYKVSHRALYPQGTELVYSTWTPRASRIENCNHVVTFGVQSFLLRLHRRFREGFFDRDVEDLCARYADRMSRSLGEASPDVSHVRALHALGYLPLEFRSLPEGTLCPIRCPMLTVHNTEPEFFWLTNYIETLMSMELWKPMTSATLALQYRQLFDKYADLTVGDRGYVDYQGHDFSMRGMDSLDAAAASGAAHLLSFSGTDTIPAIDYAKHYYGAIGGVGFSVPATEHSVQCVYQNDMRYFEAVIDKHPTGIVSIVADGYDFWDVINRVLPSLKDKIMARDGKVVVRPDSGDPVKIVCGDSEAETQHERVGAVQRLYDIFGGTRNARGFVELDPHIGLIYGDAITLPRAESILYKLRERRFAASNVVLGIGSFTYQYNTRDTFGFAMKATLSAVNGVEVPIFKDPKTDDGTKKSLRGGVRVVLRDGEVCYEDGVPFDLTAHDTLLQTVYKDGRFKRTETFDDVRTRLRQEMVRVSS